MDALHAPPLQMTPETSCHEPQKLKRPRLVASVSVAAAGPSKEAGYPLLTPQQRKLAVLMEGHKCRCEGCHYPPAIANDGFCPFHNQSFVPDASKKEPGNLCLGPEFMAWGDGVVTPSKRLCCCGQDLCHDIGYPNGGSFPFPTEKQHQKEWFQALQIFGQERARIRGRPHDYRVAYWHFLPQHRKRGPHGTWSLIPSSCSFCDQDRKIWLCGTPPMANLDEFVASFHPEQGLPGTVASSRFNGEKAKDVKSGGRPETPKASTSVVVVSPSTKGKQILSLPDDLEEGSQMKNSSETDRSKEDGCCVSISLEELKTLRRGQIELVHLQEECRQLKAQLAATAPTNIHSLVFPTAPGSSTLRFAEGGRRTPSASPPPPPFQSHAASLPSSLTTSPRPSPSPLPSLPLSEQVRVCLEREKHHLYKLSQAEQRSYQLECWLSMSREQLRRVGEELRFAQEQRVQTEQRCLDLQQKLQQQSHVSSTKLSHRKLSPRKDRQEATSKQVNGQSDCVLSRQAMKVVV